MAKYEGNAEKSDVNSGNMLFEPILEEGIFRFDCSANDRTSGFPSLSFINSTDRDTPIMSHKLPSFIPSFECVHGQQIVNMKVHQHYFSYMYTFSNAISLEQIFTGENQMDCCTNLDWSSNFLKYISHLYYTNADLLTPFSC